MISNVSRISSQATKVIVILLVFILSACSSTKKLEPETLWLKKQRVYINGVQSKDPSIINQLVQKPNQKIAGLPVKLWLYNSSGRKSNLINNWLRRIGEPPVIYTDEISEAIKISEAIQSGIVHINSYGDDDISIPFGGIKESGIGFDKSLKVFDEYSNMKSIVIGL